MVGHLDQCEASAADLVLVFEPRRRRNPRRPSTLTIAFRESERPLLALAGRTVPGVGCGRAGGGGIGVAVAPSRSGNGARPRRRGAGGADAGGAGSAALCRLDGLRRLPRRGGGALEGIGPPARLDAAGAGERARRLRRCELHQPRRDVAVHPRGGGVFRRDRRRRGAAAQVRGGRRRRDQAVAAVPAVAGAGADAGLRHRLGHGAAPVVRPLSRPGAAAARRAALDRPLQELGGALCRVPRDRLHPQLPAGRQPLRSARGRDRRGLRGLPRAGRGARRLGEGFRPDTIPRAGRG